MTHTADRSSGPDVLLSVSQLTKTFPGVVALAGVSLQVHAGEVLALLGQNGCGKSTLVKILAGVYRADSGTFAFPGANGAGARGSLHVIHQDLGLVDGLSTVENLALGRQAGVRPLHPRRDGQRARALIGRYGLAFDVLCPIRSLTPAQRTIVAIARALDGWSSPRNVLVLDEPTAALHGAEVDVLFTAVRRVAAQGAGVIFISHRLGEVTDLADRLVVLRDGRVVADRSGKGLTAESVAELITGSAATSRSPIGGPPGTEAAGGLRLREMSGGTVRSFSATVGHGEIVGVAGALGSGREDIAGLVFAALPRRGGSVELDGVAVTARSPHHAMRSGLGFIPADRRLQGAVMTLSLRENITLPDLRPLSLCRVHLGVRRERGEARRWVRELQIRPALPERPLQLFSGGNQQKAVIAKWLRCAPRVLLVDEPTQGVDIGASRAIRELLRAAAAEGMAILVTSSDSTDLIELCSRVLVMQDGAVTTELIGAQVTDHLIAQACLGDPTNDPPLAATSTKENSGG